MLVILNILEVLIILIPILMTVAFVTIAERKIMASMQRRCGPNAVGVWGILQPFADALKLLVKEIIIPRQSNSLLFVIGPCITLTFALVSWAIIPFGEGLAIFDFELGVFFALAVSSLGSYGILISGWAANSKYAFMGAIRSTAQLLSYELVFSSIVLILILFTGSFSLTYIVECQQAVWNIFPLMPIGLIFFIAILAETNRAPFDLPEAESELVAGLCGMRFTLYCWSWKALSWVIGLIQYKNHDLTSVVGIVSNLYWKLTKYVNNIMNPSKGSLGYEIIVVFYILLQLFTQFYTWTSKTMNPAERFTPCLEINWVERNDIFLYESGNSIFGYNFFNYTNSKGKTITRSCNRKIIALERGGKKEELYLPIKGSNDFFICNPTTKNKLEIMNTHLFSFDDSFFGIHYPKLNNIYPNNDGKYRKLSQFLYDPDFLMLFYKKLKILGLINHNLQLNWFNDIVIQLKNGQYEPCRKIDKSFNETNSVMNIDRLNDLIISQAIYFLLLFVLKNIKNENSFPSFLFNSVNNIIMHNCLYKLKSEWNDINWFLSFNYDNEFKFIHRKIIFSQLEKYIQDQRLFDILNKLFNSGICSLFTIHKKKTFDKYEIPNYDSLAFLLINVFFQSLDQEIWKIKNNLFIQNELNCNLRYLRNINEILIGIKGPKSLALLVKKKVEVFLESSLHLNLLNKETNLINIHSDKISCFNVVVTSLNKKRLYINNIRSNIIQQKKKGIKLRNIKANFNNKEKEKNNLIISNNVILNNKFFNINKIDLIKKNTEGGKNSLIIKSFNEVTQSIIINADLVKIKKILKNSGLLNKNNRPMAVRKILSLDSYYIIYFYKEISKLIWNTFSICDNYKDILKIVNYHIRWSLLHTLAAKHKSTIRKIIRDIYPDLTVNINNKYIRFFNLKELMKIRLNLKNKIWNDSTIISNCINWSLDNQNFQDVLKKNKNFNPLFGYENNSFFDKKMKINLEKAKIFSNKRFYSTNNFHYSNLNDKSKFNVSDFNIYNDSNNIPGSEKSFNYLINLYPYFLDNIKSNKGQFWLGENKEELTDKEFKEWFSGFVDAEGLFYIKLRKNYNNCSFVFEIHLHRDDLPTLIYIQKRLGIGNIRLLKNSAWFYISKIKEIENLISIFDIYPLWTHKQLDYNSFKQGFLNRSDYIKVVEIKNNMNRKRINFDGYIIPSCEELSSYWIIGFIEGDGCFTISKMKANFIIVQKDYQILNVIREYFLCLINENSLLSCKNYSLPHIKKKNNINPVYSFSISNQDILYYIIAPFFLRRKLLTRKGYDFFIWLICLNIVIFGYVKLTLGKIILLQLSKNMNDKRYSKYNELKNEYIYSSNTIYSIIYESLKFLFSKTPLFDLLSGKSYKELSNSYSRNKLHKNLYLKQGYSVFVYKGLSQSLDSSFSSIKEASQILNIPVYKISSYIDTGLAIRGYYLFSNKIKNN